MKMYKGFDKDMKCRGFQYEEGKEYTTDEAKLCESGFHACEYPLDCFGYYDPASSEYHEVELEDVTDEKDDDTKRVGKRIKIGAKITIAKMVDASVEYINEHLTGEKKSDMGDMSAATNTGDRSAATNTGYRSAATNTGYMSAATNTGDRSAATNTGDRSAATNTGKGGIAIVTGYKSKVKGAVGSAICVCERGEWDGNNNYPLLAVRAAIIDGETLKADTWYTLVNGKFMEVEEDD